MRERNIEKIGISTIPIGSVLQNWADFAGRMVNARLKRVPTSIPPSIRRLP
jgi:hypothetical protein